MKTPNLPIVDFETLGIRSRPLYPPPPVGVSIIMPGKKPKYYAWGHVDGNNCSWGEAKAALEEAYAYPGGIVCQNGKFDVDVAEVHMGLSIPPWEKLHDTMLLLFLDDPNQRELGLKPSAERLLDMPPDEQDEVADWLIENQPIHGVKISRSKQSEHYFGRYVAYAPASIVGKYANGDTDRTGKLFKKLYPSILEREMGRAYDRERELLPILLDMERQGVRVDVKRLRADFTAYSEWLDVLDAWVIKTLKAPSDINLNSGEQLVAAMIAAKKVDTDLMPLTPTGKFQTNKEALLLGVTDKTLLAVLKYRTQLKTCLQTFMGNWLDTAEASGGFIFTTWNQTKSAEGADAAGARTGRLSSTPPFQNMPKTFKPIFRHEEKDLTKAKVLPVCPFKDLPLLPRMRSYILPYSSDHVLIDRDYSQQEPRILAHFDGGDLMDKYIADPWTDFHDYAQSELALAGRVYDRDPVKTVNLGLIYGMGVPKLAAKIGLPVTETKALKAAVLSLYPGLKDMYSDMKQLAAAGEPIRTWGGRQYYCEEPKLIDGRLQKFDYKMVNTLIQGSAGDCTKEAIIRYYKAKKPGELLLLTVHDQLTASVPKKSLVPGMERLRVAMESVEFDVPILSEGKYSEEHWAALLPYDKKGKLLYGN